VKLGVFPVVPNAFKGETASNCHQFGSFLEELPSFFGPVNGAKV
jgi:hypothetical protein